MRPEMRPEDSAMVQKLGWIGAAIVSVVIGVCFRGTVALDGVFSGIKVCERQFFVRADPSGSCLFPRGRPESSLV